MVDCLRPTLHLDPAISLLYYLIATLPLPHCAAPVSWNCPSQGRHFRAWMTSRPLSSQSLRRLRSQQFNNQFRGMFYIHIPINPC